MEPRVNLRESGKEEAMAVLAIFTAEGLTREKYDALRPMIQWETDPAPGSLVHACGFDEAGNAHVADVWESPEQMGAFVEARLIPAFQRLGIPPPSVVVYPAHNLNVFPSAVRYQLK